MSHFDKKFFNKANNFVRDYYKALGIEQYRVYIGHSLLLRPKDFEKWIFNEYNALIDLTKR